MNDMPERPAKGDKIHSVNVARSPKKRGPKTPMLDRYRKQKGC